MSSNLVRNMNHSIKFENEELKTKRLRSENEILKTKIVDLEAKLSNAIQRAVNAEETISIIDECQKRKLQV